MIKINQARIRGAIICMVGMFLVLLSGCETFPNNWAFSKEVLNTEAHPQIRRIALLDVPIPSKIWLGKEKDSTRGAFVSFLASLLSLAEPPGQNYEGGYITSGSLISESTQQEMQKWLEKEGVEVIILKAERSDPTKMLKDYGQFAQVNADAILEIAPITVGFVPYLQKIPWDDELSPDITYKYRMLSTKDDQVLIESNVFYSSFSNQYKSGRGYKRLGPGGHIFEDVESVKKQPEEAVRRLRYAIVGATEIIARKVRLFTN